MKQYKTPTKTKEDFIIYKKVVNDGKRYLLEMFVPKGSWMYSPDIFNTHHRSSLTLARVQDKNIALKMIEEYEDKFNEE